MNTECRLCLKEKELQTSHILPSFSGKWLKNNSLTNYLRNVKNPEIRRQDLIKTPILCADCEGLFSQWEEKAASELFKPWNDNRSLDLVYDGWLERFVASLSWRTGVYCQEEFKKVFDTDQQERYDKSLESWRRFLLGSKNNCNPHEHHVFLWDAVSNAEDMQVPDKWHAYTLRGFDLSYVVYKRQILLFSHIPGISFFSTVSPAKISDSKGTWITASGILTPPQVCPPVISSWVAERAKAVSQMKVSEKQQAKIEKDVLKAISLESNDAVLQKKS